VNAIFAINDEFVSQKVPLSYSTPSLESAKNVGFTTLCPLYSNHPVERSSSSPSSKVENWDYHAVRQYDNSTAVDTENATGSTADLPSHGPTGFSEALALKFHGSQKERHIL
jgi:hypothetical protein